MRISNEIIVNQSLRRLSNRLEQFATTQSQLGTGRRFQVASEDVGGMNSSMSLRAQSRSLTQADRNIDDGRSRIDAADSKVQQMSSRLRRANELAIRGANTLQQTERDAIAEELATIRDELQGLANSRFLGQGLFAGTAEGDAVQKIAGTWTHTGDGATVRRRVGESEVVDINVTADELFGFAGGGPDLFTVLDDLETAIRAGDNPATTTAMGQLQNAQDDINNGLAKLGASGNVIDGAAERVAEEIGVLKLRQSEVEDVDLAEAVMELQTQEVALQATLGALGRALQPSLMDYLG